jgi:hypothetical protein
MKPEKIPGSSKINLLDAIPAKNPLLRTETRGNNLATVVIKRDGFIEKLARRFLKKIIKIPETLRVNLDAYGSFVWMAIDGQRTIGEICTLTRREFGDGAEPVHERICSYVKILRNNKFITLNIQICGADK